MPGFEKTIKFVAPPLTILAVFSCSTVPAIVTSEQRGVERNIESWLVDGSRRAFRAVKALTPKHSAIEASEKLRQCRSVKPGFYRVRKDGDGFSLIDGADGRSFSIGINSVSPGKSTVSKECFEKKFRNTNEWASQTARWMCESGFNTAGAWSSTALQNTELISTPILHIMKKFGESIGVTFPQGGHVGFRDQLIPVFDPRFPDFVRQAVAHLTKSKDNPKILGYFIDNELPFPIDALDRALARPVGDPAYQEATRFLKNRGQTTSGDTVTDSDRNEFLYDMARRYFEITSQAIRSVDPNHLILGSRFHGKVLKRAVVFRAAGEFVDVISVNYYGIWFPEADNLAKMSRWANRPLLISEWYAMAEDAGLKNSAGAGWVVRSQQDRGLFYENFVSGLLKLPFIIGFHWFRYMDNDPGHPGDPSNVDSNKGVVNNCYLSWMPLLLSARRANALVNDEVGQ